MPTKISRAGPKRRPPVSRDVYLALTLPLPSKMSDTELWAIWKTDAGREVWDAHAFDSKVPPWAALILPMPPWWDEQQHGRHRHLDYCSHCQTGKPCQVQ